VAIPETLRHPFATAKIVTPGTWIVARIWDACSNATLRACRRRGERTSDGCDRDENSKYLLHSRALLQTPSVSARLMHGKLRVAQTVAAAINFQILSLDETEHAKFIEKAKIGDAAIFSEGSLCEAIDGIRFLCVDRARPRDRRTTQDTKKFPPLHVNLVQRYRK
jgi:hypothetical protein